jgi:hypothetical protein
MSESNDSYKGEPNVGFHDPGPWIWQDQSACIKAEPICPFSGYSTYAIAGSIAGYIAEPKVGFHNPGPWIW